MKAAGSDIILSMSIRRETLPTVRQSTVLATLELQNHRTARWLGVRSDVLWRMEERGWVGRNNYDQWYIKDGGHSALARCRSVGVT
jgi:hypothetical protein